MPSRQEKGPKRYTPDSRPISQEGPRRSNTDSSKNSVKALLSRTPVPAGTRSVSVASDRDIENMNEDDERYGDYVHDEDGANVASKASSKVSRYLDYYNEALRRRLERELLIRPVKQPLVEATTEPFTVIYDSNDEPFGKAAAYWKKVLAKTEAVNKVAEATKARKNPATSTALSKIQKRKAAKQVKTLLGRLGVRKRFRKKTRIIIFCIRMVKDHGFKFRENSDLTPYMNTLNYIDYRNDQIKDLMFDRSQFCANRQMRISEETKRILSKQKFERTENEVYSAQIALRNIRSFAELPVRMQQMIARAGQYESYEGKRVITLEGHPPSAFYFILSGAAVAMKMDPERPIAIPIKEYVKGDNFEENPLLNDTTREVTILTKEHCEFLSISAVDYREIFMAGGVKNLNDPDMEMFLKSLHFLNGWPIEILQENPKELRFHYFKRGVILAEDSRKSPWLIIVKSGSISVMKKLRKVGPFEWRKNNGIKPLTEKESRERLHERQLWRRYVLPELRISLKTKNDFEEVEERVDGKPKPFQHPEIKVHLEEDSDSSNRKGKKYYYPNLWSYGATDDVDKSKTFSNINKQYLYTMSSSSHTAKDGRGAPKIKATVKPPATAPLPDRPRGLSESRDIPSPTHSDISQISLRSLLTSPVESEESARTPSSVFEDRLKTIAAGVRSGGDQLSDIDVNPQFVNIQTLIKGDVWGIEDLMLEDQPSFIVMSNGADCVLISKNFYKQHCSEKLEQQLKQDLCPYPSDNDLQDSLQVSVDWDEHRRCELTNTLGKVRNQRFERDTGFHPKIVESVK